jgi:DNA-binding MarR family transcriptional regulator
MPIASMITTPLTRGLCRSPISAASQPPKELPITVTSVRSSRSSSVTYAWARSVTPVSPSALGVPPKPGWVGSSTREGVRSASRSAIVCTPPPPCRSRNGRVRSRSWTVTSTEPAEPTWSVRVSVRMGRRVPAAVRVVIVPSLQRGSSMARHHRALSRALAPLGLSLVQWDTLRHLHRQPDASLHDRAVLTFQTDQSFGSPATRMADRGLIERVPGPGRAVKHRLTEEGARLRAAGQDAVDAVFASSFGTLSAAQLDRLGELLDTALGPDPTA